MGPEPDPDDGEFVEPIAGADRTAGIAGTIAMPFGEVLGAPAILIRELATGGSCGLSGVADGLVGRWCLNGGDGSVRQGGATGELPKSISAKSLPFLLGS